MMEVQYKLAQVYLVPLSFSLAYSLLTFFIENIFIHF